MKLNKLVLLPILLCSFSLASCHPEKDNSQSFSTSENDSTSINTSIYQETLYSLTVMDEGHYIIRGPFRPSTDNEKVEYAFPYDAWVIFKLGRIYDADYVVTLNEERLTYYEQDDMGYFYQFYMPAKDSVLSITLQNAFLSTEWPL